MHACMDTSANYPITHSLVMHPIPISLDAYVHVEGSGSSGVYGTSQIIAALSAGVLYVTDTLRD